MAAAFEARKVWAGTPPIERSKILFKAARNLEEKMMEVAAILQDEGGGTFGKAMFEISQTIDLIETAAADCKRILGETFHTDPTKLNMTLLRPRGTIVAIAPWNFPLILSMYKIAYGLAAGNTVVYKPASDTPVIGLKIAELFEKAGLPAGALNVVTGPGNVIGDALIDDDRCSFVTITGKRVQEDTLPSGRCQDETVHARTGRQESPHHLRRRGHRLCREHFGIRDLYAPRADLHVCGPDHC
jgi:aldehyde dehydrogenase (NAD+)